MKNYDNAQPPNIKDLNQEIKDCWELMKLSYEKKRLKKIRHKKIE
jgi:hypothetical protein